MDKASDFGSEDCEFESRRGRCFLRNFSDFIGVGARGAIVPPLFKVGGLEYLLYVADIQKSPNSNTCTRMFSSPHVFENDANIHRRRQPLAGKGHAPPPGPQILSF